MQLLSVHLFREWQLCLLLLLACSCSLRFYSSAPLLITQMRLDWRGSDPTSGLGDNKKLPHCTRLSASIITVCKNVVICSDFLFNYGHKAGWKGLPSVQFPTWTWGITFWTNAVEYPAHLLWRKNLVINPLSYAFFDVPGTQPSLLELYQRQQQMFGKKEGAVQSLFNFCGQTYYCK